MGGPSDARISAPAPAERAGDAPRSAPMIDAQATPADPEYWQAVCEHAGWPGLADRRPNEAARPIDFAFSTGAAPTAPRPLPH